MSEQPLVVSPKYLTYAGTVGTVTAWLDVETGDLASLDIRQVTQPHNMPVRLTRDEAIALAKFVLENAKQ